MAVPIWKNNKISRLSNPKILLRHLDNIPGIPFSESWEYVVFDETNTKLAPLKLANNDFKTTVAITGGTGAIGIAGGAV